MIKYNFFKEYCSDLVIKDRVVFQENEKLFLMYLNKALIRLASDLNTIDSDYYHQEKEVSIEIDKEINLGESLGFGGAYFVDNTSYFASGTKVPHLKRSNKTTPYGILDYYNNDDELIVKFVTNESFVFTSYNKMVLMYSKYPATVIAGANIEAPKRLYPQLANLMNYFYFFDRQYMTEAQYIISEYNEDMNTYIKWKTPSMIAPSIGKSVIPPGGYIRHTL